MVDKGIIMVNPKVSMVNILGKGTKTRVFRVKLYKSVFNYPHLKHESFLIYFQYKYFRTLVFEKSTYFFQ